MVLLSEENNYLNLRKFWDSIILRFTVMLLRVPEVYFPKYCQFALNISYALLHIKEILLCISILHQMPAFFPECFFVVVLFCTYSYPSKYAFLNRGSNKSKNLNCPMFFRRLHFYSHLELFNYLCFALLASFFSQATDVSSSSSGALFLTDTLQIAWVVFQLKLDYLRKKENI
jgi:hypothetical protein